MTLDSKQGKACGLIDRNSLASTNGFWALQLHCLACFFRGENWGGDALKGQVLRETRPLNCNEPTKTNLVFR